MPKFKKIAVVGIGLIGASLAAALKKYDPNIKITAVDRCLESIKKAEKLEIIDQGFTELKDNLSEAELIFIAVPVAAIPSVIRKIKDGSKGKQLLVDAGSTKKEIMLQAKEILAGTKKIFVGGHPMAGSHKSGLDWHQVDLFKDAPFILTPWIEESKSLLPTDEALKNSNVEEEQLQQLKELIENLKAKVHIISAEEHDRCTAYLSHLPHLLSSALVNLSSKRDLDSSFLELSGSGYRDMTRIAGSSPELWQDIIISNRKNLSELVTEYIAELKELQLNLENNEENKIYNFLASAAEIKNKSREK
ncbi:Prephenate and/or arogenate dehydrogenase (unknown specificity) |uniref:Prephenate/arogenate dehydrogenase domain-containing protein n=1 Tax=Halanaerobium saccharolyticum subsp. saccharolyticum DSM 6643 TaxID=1293054 RepID=M5EFK6_9FIRM|nr:prephenate dehydrogenase/arogenate dehydrogenase family protein [Halanaerobium saccharolyticum]CCU79978.1 Prephenate and/or arogenate dehydrogenase (unknown specificity) \